MKCRKQDTVRLVSNKLVIDDDLDSDTVTESNLSPKSRSILEKGERSIAKDIGPSYQKMQ